MGKETGLEHALILPFVQPVLGATHPLFRSPNEKLP
jgi:hypothetical protein